MNYPRASRLAAQIYKIRPGAQPFIVPLSKQVQAVRERANIEPEGRHPVFLALIRRVDGGIRPTTVWNGGLAKEAKHG